jgi:hypothetical protein
MEVTMNPLRAVILFTVLSISGLATAEDMPGLQPAPPQHLIEADKLASLEIAVQEAMRLKDSCNASDIRLCQPTPPCDAQGQRPYPWQDCILAWEADKTGKEMLVWVNEWEVEANLGYRRPVIGVDGKLY